MIPLSLRPQKLAAIFSLTALTFAAAAENDAPPLPPAMREMSPGIYQIGKLRLDQKALTISFPGTVNMDSGALEYLLVTPEGSAHESLLLTEIQPNDLHFAMLLLGAKGAGLAAPGAEDAPPPQIDSAYLKNAPKLKGDTIFISVKWKTSEEEKTVAVEDWLATGETKKTAERGPWIYTGSMFSGGHFLAQSDGAFAAVVTNPSALINNPRKGNDNDGFWAVNEKTVPPRKTPVEIIIKLAAPKAPESTEPKAP